MNTSSPCPTSGMNNQIAMLLGLMYCATHQKDAGHSAGENVATILNSDFQAFLASQNPFLSIKDHNQASSRSLKLSPSIFHFKDISCSPTGGKEGSKRYKVGSDDYDYAWFRWSEIFDVNGEGAVASLVDANTKSVHPSITRVCLRDQFSWSEHKWMKARTCATTVDHFYGTDLYWRIRGLLPLHQWYFRLAEEFLIWASNKGKDTDRSSIIDGNQRGSSTTLIKTIQARTLAIHVRRGDYYNFCKNTAKSSGVKKFRIAPFIWMKNNGAKSEAAGLADIQQLEGSEKKLSHYNNKFLNLTSVSSLSSKFMDSCAPLDWKVFQAVEGILAENAKRCSPSSSHATIECIDTLIVMTNSKEFYSNIKAHFSAKAAGLKIVSMHDWMQTEANKDANRDAEGLLAQALKKVQWPVRRTKDSDEQSQHLYASKLTTTEAAMMDVALLSLANTVVLNRYSTFSQSAIDVRAVRDHTLEGLRLYWW